MWGRQLGALAGVTVPLQAAEHYYLLTDTVEWAHPDLPVVEDPDRYGYYREEAGGILVGLFEPVGGAVVARRHRRSDLGFAVLPPDWDRMARFLSDAMDRFPALHDAGIRQFFCGPESFTPDIGPLLGEAPELRRVLHRLRAQLRSASCSRAGRRLVDDAVDPRRRAGRWTSRA